MTKNQVLLFVMKQNVTKNSSRFSLSWLICCQIAQSSAEHPLAGGRQVLDLWDCAFDQHLNQDSRNRRWVTVTTRSYGSGHLQAPKKYWRTVLIWLSIKSVAVTQRSSHELRDASSWRAEAAQEFCDTLSAQSIRDKRAKGSQDRCCYKKSI